MSPGQVMCTRTLTTWSHVCYELLHTELSGRSMSVSGVADSKNLMPMYKKLHTAIRQHDNDHIIFYEPTSIITDVSNQENLLFSSSHVSLISH